MGLASRGTAPEGQNESKRREIVGNFDALIGGNRYRTESQEGAPREPYTSHDSHGSEGGTRKGKLKNIEGGGGSNDFEAFIYPRPRRGQIQIRGLDYLVPLNQSGITYDDPGPTTSAQASRRITGDTSQIQRARCGISLSHCVSVPPLRDCVHMVCRKDRNVSRPC